MNPDPHQQPGQPQSATPLTPEVSASQPAPYVAPVSALAPQPETTPQPVAVSVEPVFTQPSVQPLDSAVPVLDPTPVVDQQSQPAPIAAPVTESAASVSAVEPIAAAPAFEPVPATQSQVPPIAPFQAGVPATPATEPAAPSPFGPAPDAAATPAFTPIVPVGKGPLKFLNGPKKKLFIVIGVIIAVLILLGVAAIVAASIIFPSQKDYTDASTQYSQVYAAYTKLDSAASALQYDITGSATDTQYTNDLDTFTKSLTTFQDENTTLSKMKAVKVGDGETYYKAYEAKVGAFVTYNQNVVASLKAVRPAAKTCGDASTIAAFPGCVTALNNIGDIADADIKQFIGVLKTQYAALVDVLNQISAITSPYGSQATQYTSLRNQTYDIEDKISAASSDLTSNVTKHANEVDVSKEANALDNYLIKQISN